MTDVRDNGKLSAMDETAQEYWDASPGLAIANPWFSNHRIVAGIYSRISGGKPVHWLAWLMNEYLAGRRFNRMLSPGCGTGEHEVFVGRTKRVAEIDAFDLSQASLNVARNKAAEASVTANFYKDNLNSFTIPAARQYDLVMCSGSVHHVRELERFFEHIHAACTPDAVFVLNEYIGACYNLYPPRQVAMINRLLNAIPASLRRCERITIESLQAKLRADPSESVRSTLILPIMEQYFTIELRRDYGGGLLHPMYRLLDHATLANGDPRSEAVVGPVAGDRADPDGGGHPPHRLHFLRRPPEEALIGRKLPRPASVKLRANPYTRCPTMEMTELSIAGAKLISLKRFDDSRGSFCEAFRASWLQNPNPWVQWNVSRSKQGVLRGLHIHQRQTDYWHIVAGNVTAALVDNRPSSPTYRKALTVPLSADVPQTLVIPTGIFHGFYGDTDVVLMYLLDQEYDPSDEKGVRWDDPALGLPAEWYGKPTPILSPRDAGAPMLKDLKL